MSVQLQSVQRAGCADAGALHDVSVDLGGADIAVAQQLLHGADVGTGLEQVGSEAVAKGVRVHGLGESSRPGRLRDGALDRAGVENYQITLATGSLLVDGGPESRSVRLRPGEQGFFERTSGLLSLRRVNVEQVLSWQEDRLYFRAEPLASIARSLERQFNVDITIPDERLRRICFTGEFVDGENIHEIMRIISADSRILCRSRKNHFELYRNR